MLYNEIMEVEKIFCELAKIPGPSRKEAKIAQKVASILAEIGLEVFFDRTGEKIEGEIGNLYAFLPGLKDSSTLLLNAHLDTIESTKGLKIAKKRDYAYSVSNTILGADNRAGIAVIIAALKQIIEKKLPHPGLEIVFTVAEEVGLLGARNIDFSKIKARVGLVLDGGKGGTIIHRAPSQEKIVARFKGRAAHAGVEPEKGINSIKAAAIGVASLKLGKIDDETTANVGVIKGGTATNVIPEETVVEAEVRSRDEKKLKKVRDEMIASFRKGAREVKAKVQVEKQLLYKGFNLPTNSSWARIVFQAAKEAGLKPAFESTCGGSDTNVFNLHKIETFNIGVGALNPHSRKEKLSLKEMEKSVRWLINICAALTEQ